MKIILGKQRRRGWVLWVFLIVIAATIVLCKIIVNWANALMPPTPPPPPPCNTNYPPTTNPPAITSTAMFFMVASGDGAPPLISTITYGLMPVGTNVQVVIVDQTAPALTPPGPVDPATWTNNCMAWLNNWGVDVDGSLAADWSEQGYIRYTDDGLWHWVFETAEQPGAPVTLDYDSFTYTLASAPQEVPAYALTIQRSDDATMVNLTNLDTKTVTVGQFQTFIDYAAPSNAAFYRIAYHKQ